MDLQHGLFSGGGGVVDNAFSSGRVFFGIDNGTFYAFNEKSGALIWTFQTESYIKSSPAISDGMLFIGSNDGVLYSFK